MHDTNDINTFLTTEDLAVRYDLKPDTIKRWRVRGRGPTFYKAGQIAIDPRTPRIRYKLADVLAWEQSLSLIHI